MARILFIFLLFVCFNGNAQSYLGKSRKEIAKLAKTDFSNPKVSFNSNSEHTYVKIINEYESLYYYLENDVCVKFVVYKPYSCNCLEADIQAYKSQLISYGDLKWVSKDNSKIYEITLYGNKYSISIVPHVEYLTSKY